MAALGCGSYRFANNSNSKKSYCIVKLTESANKALEEYVRTWVSVINFYFLVK